MSVAAILLCAGRGQRLGAGIDKALVPLAGRPLFTWSLETLARTRAIEGIVVVGPVARLQRAAAESGVATASVVAWCEGGRERHHSVKKGLAALPAGFDVVAVHDSARALVPPEVVARVLADALTHGAAIAAVPVDDTLKRVALGTIEGTVPRAGLWRAQTPQAFRRDWLEAAHSSGGAATDDAGLVEALGHRVHISEGDAVNLKITTARDLALAEAWLTARAERTT